MDETLPDETLLSLSSYWIQGRQGDIWRNIESHKDPLRAVRHLQLLIVNDQHDELRLILARASAITGEVEYSHMASFEGGGTRTPDDEEVRESLAQTRPWDPEHEAAPLPQTSLWQEEEQDGQDVQALLMDLKALHRKNAGEEIAGISLAGDETPLPLPEDDHGAAEETVPEPVQKPSTAGPLPAETAEETSFIPQPDRWTTKAPLRNPDLAPRQDPARERKPPPPLAAPRRRRKSRAALYGVLMAGAATLGLAIATAHPDQSARLTLELHDRFRLLLPEPPLTTLVRAGNLPGVQLALARGDDPNATDLEGIPLLMIAAERQDYRIMDSLIRAGADPHRRLSRGGQHPA